MAGITFSQLRTVTNPGLEGVGATDQIQVKVGTGLATDATGVYVDGTAATFKAPVRVRAVGNVSLALPGATIDSVSMSSGDRVLLADQSTPSEDGIYVFDSGATPLVRAEDAPSGAEAAGWYVQCLEGSTYADTLFRVDADQGGATIGTDGWTLATFSGSDTTRSAGAGLIDGAGLDLDVNTGDGIAVSSDRVVAQVATAGSAQQYGGLVRNRSADGSSVGTADQGYLAVATDNSTLVVTGSNLVAINNGGVTETQLNTSVAGAGLTGGGGSALAVGAGTGITVNANDVEIDTTSTVTFLATTAWTFPNGVTAEGLFVTGTPVDANHVVNKSYVDNVSTGITWLQPASVLEYIGTRTVTEINGLSPTQGMAVVASDAGTPSAGTSDLLAAGDIAEYDGTSWKVIVTNSGGFPPSGTRAVVAYPSSETLYSPLTDGTDEGKIAEWDGSSLTPALTTPTDGDALLIAGESSVNENAAYVFDGSVPSGQWVQFSGAGQINAGTGLVKSGNTINVVAGTATNSFATILTNTDDIEVKYESPGAGQGGLTTTANGLRVLVQPAGASTGGLALTATGLRVSNDIVTTPGSGVASVLKLTANGLGVGVDDSTVEASAASGVLRVKDLGITTGKLAANAVTLAKTNIRFREEEFAASAFALSGSEYQVTLSAAPLVGNQADFYAQCYRNGVADMTNVGNATQATTATEFRVLDDSGTGRLRIGADITSSGNTYRVRYLSLAGV